MNSLPAPPLPLLLLALLAVGLAHADRTLYARGAAHPHLLCTAAELDAVRGRLDRGVEALAYREMLRKCDGYLDPKSPLYVDWPERKHHCWRDRGGATWLTKCFEELAWAGVLSGEQKYVDGAKHIVLTIIRERVIDQIGGLNYGQPCKGWLSQPLDAGHFSRSLTVWMAHEARPTRLTVNGQEQRFTVAGNAVRAEGALPQRGELVLTWQPPVVVAATQQQLLGFPFERDGQATAEIVLPAGAGAHDEYLAQFLRAYFDYWTRRQTNAAGAVAELADVPARCVLPIAPADAASSGKPRVVFSATGPGARVSLASPGAELVISGPTPELRARALRRLLGLLDAKYPCQGVYPDAPIYQRAGLVGKVL